MKQTFRYGGYAYEYFVEFSERKVFTLIVRPDLRIIARVPLDATLDEVEAFLRRKWKWLEKQLKELHKYQKSGGEPRYVSGRSLHYLGRQYMLEVVPCSFDEVKLEHGKLRVRTTKEVRNSAYNQKLVEGWYASRRVMIFKQEYVRALKLFYYAKPPQLRERIMARRWGSYTADNQISLNPKLIQASKDAIYYVCIHELCHVVNRKHDKAFYEELEKRLPDWHLTKETLEVRYG